MAPLRGAHPEHGGLLPPRMLRLWRSNWAGRIAASLVAAAAVTLFLSSAATVDVGYTLRVSQVLLAVACLAGAPLAWEGWQRVPELVRWSAVLLVSAYVVAAALGQEAVLTAGARAGSTRDLAYIADLTLGLAGIALILGLSAAELSPRALALALAVGAGLAAVYGLYQWPAQQFAWPLADVNNTLDSNGETVDGSQGPGLFGWTRIRGTFLEPHVFAAYTASLLPLALFAAWSSRGRLRLLAGTAGVATLVALALTASLSSWLVLAFGLLVGGTVMVIGRGLVLRSACAGAAVLLALTAAPMAVLASDRLAAVTGRNASDLTISSDFRRTAWERAMRTWSERPVLGFGPGQSAVRSALDQPNPEDAAAGRQEVLGSSHGLWAASLIDTGVVGFGIWCVFLGAIFVTGATAVLRNPEPLLVCAFTAAAVSVAGAEVVGDRLDLRTWMLLGLLLTVSATGRGASGGDRSERRGKPQPSPA